MQLMILRPDGLVAVDGAALSGLDLSALAPEVHAVHWSGERGEVERRDPATGAMLAPQALTDEAEVLERFDAALVAHAAALAAAQAPAPPMPLEQARAMYLAAVDAEHEQALLRLTGHPTDAEKASWAGKVELARRLLEGGALAPDHEAFLTGRGLTTPEARAAYAAEVMGNSARYWVLVGLADRVRSEAKARINAVTDAAQWPEVGAANRAARDAALAMVAQMMAPAEPEPEPAPEPTEPEPAPDGGA